MGWTLVTGGAKRLGAEICRTLAGEGKDVLIHYRTSAQEAEAVAGECRAKGVEAATIQGDFSTLKEVQHFITKVQKDFPRIENLVNNVGNILIGSGLQTPIDSWEALFQTNFHTPNALIHAFLPSIKSENGAILNIGNAGSTNGLPKTKFTAYSLTKNALFLLTQSLAKELAPDGVRVNMVSPGEIENSVTLQESAQLPMRRPASTTEVAEVAAFLLKKNNEYITGQNIEVAGGLGL